MMYSEDTANVMATRIYKEIGRAWISKNLSTPKSEEEILQLLNFSLKSDGKQAIDEFDKKNLRCAEYFLRQRGRSMAL